MLTLKTVQRKFANAIVLKDEVMFKQALHDFATVTGKKNKNEHTICTCHDRLSNNRRSSGSSG